tara:strand:- start:334 stop:573 length:240 start_codon:yes stop_codon:yes gene_type:complete
VGVGLKHWAIVFSYLKAKNVRNEYNACTSTQTPLQLDLRAPEFCDVPDKPEKGESTVVTIDLVTEDESEHGPGVIVIEL